MRKVSVLIVLSLVIALLAACGDQPSGGEQSSKDDKSITVLVEGGSPAYTVATETKEEFEDLTGYEVNIESVPYVGVYDRLRTEMSSQTGSFDVATIDIIWFPAIYQSLEPINELITDEIENDLFPGLLDATTMDEDSFALPVWTNSKILLYREDLFADEENKELFAQKYGYELAPPTSWQEYRDVAKFFTQDTNGDGSIDLYGTSVFGANSGDSVASWLDHVAQAGAESFIIDESNHVIVNDKAHVEALEFLKSIVHEDESVPVGVLETASAETSELFYNGKLAMMLAWGHFYVPANDPKTSKVAGSVGAAPMIGGNAGIGVVPGPWYQVIPSSSKKKDIAKEYLQFMYEKNELYTEALGVASRQSVFNKFGEGKKFDHLNALSTTLNAPQTTNRPSVPQWQQIESEALVPAVQRTLSGDTSPQEALDEAKNIIERILNN
ncbi:ABC transporter substrate-binding protein [Halalkalibacter alkalisediminis]|uniref:ABC transporter substrate-binding protein n=1 Tax=Halalkalibacter alkalisediminis TaxID=935616 RepID=A0ABV6NEJ7_9BACI|nr:sugar ABC transporter substrate-binding protein [Halalkalibacter alkalisediminis]